MTKSRKNHIPDVLIIGGGPAGLSAFRWCVEFGLSSVLVEADTEFGGQLRSIYNPISNYLGRVTQNGREMLAHFLSQIAGLEKHAIINCSVIEFDPQTITAMLSNGETLRSRTAIIATGVRRRQLGVPGEREFIGRGILESGAKDKAAVKGKTVAIIGGGDAALENALILSEFADKVYVIHRRAELSARSEFVKPSIDNAKIEFVLDSTVNEFLGDGQLSAISISKSGIERRFEVEAALIRIGVQPNSENFGDGIERDPSGYIMVDRLGAASVENVFAIGDVANPSSPTISTAVGNGATAVKVAFHLICGRSGS